MKKKNIKVLGVENIGKQIICRLLYHPVNDYIIIYQNVYSTTQTGRRCKTGCRMNMDFTNKGTMLPNLLSQQQYLKR